VTGPSVRVASATRKGRDVDAELLVVGGRNPAGLRHDPEVVARVRSWLGQEQRPRQVGSPTQAASKP
jgi:hypothetical protein